MKNTILTIISALIIILSNAQQIESNTISQADIYNIDCKYVSMITNDFIKTGYISLSFQNEKYSYINDKAAILITDTIILNDFISELKSAIEICNDKTTKHWIKKTYSILAQDFSKKVYLCEAGTLKYTSLNKKNAIQLVEWLESLDRKYLVPEILEKKE